ncbi:MAG TPA: hypothetical protein VFW19_13245 [Allosphingosinicella sp.]|nr:hypothetical protein [Allosphingosinicella sp.]
MARNALLAIAAFLVATAAPAAAPADPAAAWQGIWEGRIGTLPVRACFVKRDWGAFGAYYYLSRLQLIPLERGQDADGTFREGVAPDAKSPRWTLESAGANALAGRWTANGRTLPIQLARVAGPAGDESPCASLAFHAPRLAGIRIVARPAARDGLGYTRLILDHRGRFEDTKVETFALAGGSGAVRRINEALRAPLAGDPPAWLDCIRGALETGSSEGEMDETIAPRLITPRWLTAEDHEESDCGGAHPNSSNAPLTFDRTTGAQVDLNDWLNDKAIKRENYGPGTHEAKTLRPEFRNVLLARWKPQESECGDVVRQADFWTVALTRAGLVFAPELAHVDQGCGEDIAISFARLRPYLSAEGMKQVDALQAWVARGR